MELLREIKAAYHGDTMLNGLEKFKYIEENIKLDPNVLFALTYHPDLIRIALPYIQANKESLLESHKKYSHPLVHQLMHQSTLLYGKQLINDSRYDQARENLVYFVRQLKEIAPEFFELRDKYNYLPLQRFEYVDKTHPATIELVKLLE